MARFLGPRSGRFYTPSVQQFAGAFRPLRDFDVRVFNKQGDFGKIKPGSLKIRLASERPITTYEDGVPVKFYGEPLFHVQFVRVDGNLL